MRVRNDFLVGGEGVGVAMAADEVEDEGGIGLRFAESQCQRWLIVGDVDTW